MEIKETNIRHQITTLAYLLRTNKEGRKEYLLGKHHKQLKWNGFGGKVGDKEEFKDESIVQSLKREGLEEFEVMINNPKKVGEILFDFYDQEGKKQIVQSHVFLIEEFKGKPKETAEMLSPTWFRLDEIPWEEMWPHDKLWLKDLLNKNQYLEAEFIFDPKDKLISSVMNWSDGDNK